MTYYATSKTGDRVEAFRQSDTFMTDFDQFGSNIHDRPRVGESLGLRPYDFPKIDQCMFWMPVSQNERPPVD